MKLNLLLAVLTSSLLLNASILYAQETKQLTLKEAIDLSITNSKQLKISQAKIDEAVASLREAEDRKLPDVKISGAYLRLPVTPNVDLKVKNNNDGGGEEGGNSPNVSQAAYGIANISLPIYSGLRIKYGIESAKYLEKAARLDAAANHDELVLNTISAFINLYKAQALVDLVKESLQQSQQRVKDFNNLEKNGLLARNDLLKAQLQTSNIELSLLEAESNSKIAGVNMNLMLGFAENTILIPDSSLEAPEPIKSVEDYEQMAFQKRKDIEALSLRRKAAGDAVKIAKGELYPGIALTGGYVAAWIPDVLTITNAVNIGVGVQYSLSSLWKTTAKVQQAKSRELQLQTGEAQLNDEVRLQINQAYQGYLLSEKKIEVYNKAVDQATENYRITKNKYDNSLVTTTDLLDADVAQLQAKLNYAAARADAIVAYNKLLQAAGALN